MMNYHFFIFWICMSLGLCSSCRKSNNCFNPSLPPITSNGASTLGCKWNGDTWINYREIHNHPDSTLFGSTHPEDNRLNISGILRIFDECLDVDQRLFISIQYDEQDNIINFFTSANDWGRTNPAGAGGFKYIRTPTDSVTFRVHKFNRAERIFAAEFSGTLRDTLSGEVLVLEEGRLDVGW